MIEDTVSVSIPPRVALLDTNIVHAYFGDEGDKTNRARFVIEQYNDATGDDLFWLVSTAVVVEYWGLLTRARSDRRPFFTFINWLATPGTSSHINELHTDVKNEADILSVNHGLDVVDVSLVCLADRLSAILSSHEPVAVITFDVSDFLRLKNTGKQYRILDANEAEWI